MNAHKYVRKNLNRKRFHLRHAAGVLCAVGLLLSSALTVMSYRSTDDRDNDLSRHDEAPQSVMSSESPLHTASGNTDSHAALEPIPTTQPFEDSLPSEYAEPSMLTLVNIFNPLPDDYAPQELIEIGNGERLDIRGYSDFVDMVSAMPPEVGTMIVCSSFRTRERQQELFDNKVNRLMNESGLDYSAAYNQAMTVVALPGTSEHELGLALDIVDSSYQMLDEEQENTPVQRWLMENSWQYGFILRYPSEKSDITGIIYEPWHYRYVGKTAAKEMHEQGLCLEEYISNM